MNERQVCNCCHQNRRLKEFPVGRKTCKTCYAGKERVRAQCAKNARISRLIRWPAVGILVIVTGFLSHDYLSGRNRICVYETLYGDRAVTIDALRICPLTWEFEE